MTTAAVVSKSSPNKDGGGAVARTGTATVEVPTEGKRRNGNHSNLDRILPAGAPLGVDLGAVQRGEKRMQMVRLGEWRLPYHRKT